MSKPILVPASCARAAGAIGAFDSSWLRWLANFGLSLCAADFALGAPEERRPVLALAGPATTPRIPS